MDKKHIIVPLGGNSFITNKEQSERDGILPDGWHGWSNPDYEYHIYFKPAIDSRLRLTLLCRKTSSPSVIAAGIGTPDKQIKVAAGITEIPLGVHDCKAGYVDVAVKGISREGKAFAFPTDLRVEGVEEKEMAAYARPEDKKDFYWIRRGPSVHCGYNLSEIGEEVEWFYNEVTIQPGDDPHGTYGMAIGFHGGYFGMQVCDGGVRKLIFSVWAPFQTDDPALIPEEKRIIVKKKHPLVWTGEFGSEGAGGQSFMRYEWQSGQTYRFLCRIRPVENDRTEFTSYFFFPETGRWELLCCFLRPETQTWFKGAYSFLESFIDVNGHKHRKVSFSNQWAVTKSGRWVPIDAMRLTGDSTARRAMRQDYGGGVEGNHFFLHNCGFFSPNDTLDTIFHVDKSKMTKPEIDLELLEKP